MEDNTVQDILEIFAEAQALIERPRVYPPLLQEERFRSGPPRQDQATPVSHHGWRPRSIF
jgi:hypothetical protein